MTQCPCCNGSIEELPWLGCTPVIPFQCPSCNAQLYVKHFWLSFSLSIGLLLLALLGSVLSETLWPLLALVVILVALLPFFHRRERLVYAPPRVVWSTRIVLALLVAASVLPDVYRALAGP